jgi:hypothetical protein
VRRRSRNALQETCGERADLQEDGREVGRHCNQLVHMGVMVVLLWCDGCAHICTCDGFLKSSCTSCCAVWLRNGRRRRVREKSRSALQETCGESGSLQEIYPPLQETAGLNITGSIV